MTDELDSRVHRALAADSRVRLLRVLTAASRPLSAGELAEGADLHPTTVRSHLGVLVEAGLVESEPEGRTTPGRPRLLYRASAGPQSHAGGYRLLAEVLAEHLAATAADPVEQARTAGLEWGRYLVDGPPPFTELTAEQVRARVVELFATLGFDPQLADEGARLLLRRCPFIDLARRHPDVVCSMHLGLLQGALEMLGAPGSAGALEPLVEPSLCVVHLNGHTSP